MKAAMLDLDDPSDPVSGTITRYYLSLIVLIGQLAAESAQKKKAGQYADMVARRYRKRFK